MRLEQLEYLIAIRKYGSMHAAARALYVSQQSISKAMQELEDELQITILTRSSRGTLLTEEGQDIYLHAIEVKKEIDEITKKYEGKENKKPAFKNILKIYVSNHVFNLASDHISRFSIAYDAKINIVEIGTREIIQTIESESNVELAIIQCPIDDLQNNELILNRFSCYVVANERLKLVMNKNSKYAQYSSISLKTLSDIPLLINSTSIDDLPVHVQVLVDMGVKLNIQYITNAKASERYLRDNLACALSTDINFRTLENQSFSCIKPIKEKIYVATSLLVKKQGLSDISEAFVENVLKNSHPQKIF